MKLENMTDLYFVLSVFVPGFIYCSVVSYFVPQRWHRDKILLVLSLLTATAFNDALSSSLIYMLTAGVLFPNRPARNPRHGRRWIPEFFHRIQGAIMANDKGD